MFGLPGANGIWTLLWLRLSRAGNWTITPGMAAGIPLLLLLFERLLRLELYRDLLINHL
jgi:hypothetical protein